jgi:hypothetical protein
MANLKKRMDSDGRMNHLSQINSSKDKTSQGHRILTCDGQKNIDRLYG